MVSPIMATGIMVALMAIGIMVTEEVATVQEAAVEAAGKVGRSKAPSGAFFLPRIFLPNPEIMIFSLSLYIREGPPHGKSPANSLLPYNTEERHALRLKQNPLRI